MRYVLDTHVLLWWFQADDQLARAQRRILRHADPEHPLWVSDISLWEVAMLHSLGRIRLQLPLRDWLDRATAPPLVMRAGISPAVAAEVATLPASLPGDPADRIILATAHVLGAALLTRDRRLVDARLVRTVS